MNTPTLTISPVTVQDMDEYYCVATSGGGKFTDTSNIAVIAVVDMNPKSKSEVIANYSNITNQTS